ncbi:MAG: sugar kinase [Lentisphaeraceae bacterium]|nr:sugar kinase [Lentisphaeraceae bacterium]
MSKTLVTFGEVMGRFNTARNLRLTQACPGNLQITFGGAEANVAASVSILGGTSRYVTALPKHNLAEACVRELRGVGVDCDYITRTDIGRLGLYFVETGANQRPSRVIYDREDSSVSLTPGSDYDWDAIYEGAGSLHISGITPALSKIAAESTLLAAQEASKRGVKVSCDLNFRKALWQWEEGTAAKDLAKKVMSGILEFVDIIIANEEDASDVLGIDAGHTDVNAGQLEIDKYPEVAAKIVQKFPKVSKVAITLRESFSATHNAWGAMLYDASSSKACFAPQEAGEYKAYQIKNIVDRVGGGDSFAAGLIFALNFSEFAQNDQDSLSFAVASSCLAHSNEGDYNQTSYEEAVSLMGGSASGRVVR